MSKEIEYIAEKPISFAEILRNIHEYLKYLLINRKRVFILFILFLIVYISYRCLRKPVYTAETTFVIDIGSKGSGGQLSSLASIVGFDLTSLSNTSTLFQTDNIIELYRSKKMIRESFLSSELIEDRQERLITRWGRHNKKLEKWKQKTNDDSFSFEISAEDFTILHDSILSMVVKNFRDDHMDVKKPDRKTTILSVKVFGSDPLFTKKFNEVLVRNVNDFYLQTRTKKTGVNVATLQKQADSVRKILDNSLLALGNATEQIPNPNRVYKSNLVPIQKLQIDVEANAAIYQEIVKNLEVAKVNHLDNTPLIQIIDKPILPLESDEYTWFKLVVISVIFSGVLTWLFYTGRYLLGKALSQ